MNGLKRLSLESVVGLYFLSYLPNIIILKHITSHADPLVGRPLTGLETLPASMVMNLVMTLVFVWMAGWYRDAHQVSVGKVSLPVPTFYTALSGVGTAFVLFTVPLSFTFTNVSIPFIQLLMRGDILIIAPLVDLMFGRKVRWWSWVALVLVAAALLVVIRQRGGFHLPPIAWLTVGLYTTGYFIRLAVMTRVAKNGEPGSVRRYFVEEKMVALPLAILALGAISASGFGGQSGQLEFGFIEVWTHPVIWQLFLAALTLSIISVFAVLILLDARENTYCVPMERASSLVAGTAAAFILHWIWGYPAPTGVEVIGAALLIGAIVLLAMAPNVGRRRSGLPGGTDYVTGKKIG
jgi:hypothetical protein